MSKAEAEVVRLERELAAARRTLDLAWRAWAEAYHDARRQSAESTESDDGERYTGPVEHVGGLG